MRGLLRLALPSTWPKVGGTPSDVVFAENKLRLLHYRSHARAESRPVLLVPSLINRHYVLDLLPGKSFVEYLLAAGHDVYAIDWGTPSPEDRSVTFAHVVDRYLGHAVRTAARRSGRRVHLFGYCLGGTLAAIHAVLRPQPIASLALVAAPIDFSDDGLLSTWTRSRRFDLDSLVDGYGNVPWQVMQSAFHLLRPTLGLWKSVRLVEKASDDEFMDGFLALETWGNDNVSFPGECYREYVRELYQKNALASGALFVSGEKVRLESLRAPTMVVTFEHDHIVPKASATAILGLARNAPVTHLHLVGGHVGAMVAKSAAKGLWPALSKFWREHDGFAE
ncbi:MAG: alpha/beta fold hydrolase [Deltaproteobacteria bacterium]|nr:alpha/beta fold hydrolase [Deltaproteobacteria bacterium]